MKILILNTTEHTGGAAVAANRLLRALLRSGVSATMLVRDRATSGCGFAGSGSRAAMVEFPLFCLGAVCDLSL